MDNSIFESVLDIIAGIGIGFGLLMTAISIFMLVCSWRIYTKMGQPGWACIIPIYNNYVLATALYSNGVLGFLTLIPVVGWLIGCKMIYDTAKCLGKSGVFGVLNVFFSLITYPMLAFSSAQYVGPTEITKF